MESKKPLLSSLGLTSYADAAVLAEHLAKAMESMVGYRFYPTDEELVLFYLKRKICGLHSKLEVIHVIDIYKCDPEDLPTLSILQNRDKEWFFFSVVERKRPNSLRLNRTSEHGQWRITGNDRVIKYNSRKVGVKKTLVYFRRKTDHTNWVMHEFSLHEEELKRCKKVQDHYILCKAFKRTGPGSKMGKQHGAPVMEEDSEEDDPMDFDINSSGVGEGIPADVLLGDEPSLDVDDLHELLSILHAPAPTPAPLPVPELHVDAYFMIPHILPDHPQDAEGEVFPMPEPEPEPEPPRNALLNGNRNENGGQPHEAPQENHPPAGIHVEEIQPDINDILEFDDLLGPFPASPNVVAPLQNVEVELVENNGFFMIDPLLLPGMVIFPGDARQNDEDVGGNNDEDVWPEQDVISHSYENSPAGDTDTENSVLRSNQEAGVQIHGGGENNVLGQAENCHVSLKQVPNNDFAPSDDAGGGASSSSSHVD